MLRRLPSLNALRAFEASARHLSFTRAATELNVTPAAVGHQVKALEDHLGARVFQRTRRGLRLTAVGQALFPGVEEGFERLAGAVDQARQREAGGALVVSVVPTFASKWLVPRLYHFAEAHEEISVRIEATDRPVDLLHEDVDLAIRLGPGPHKALHADVLFEEEVFPVCSPALLRGEHPLRTPSDLRWHTLLHVDWQHASDAWVDWGRWLEAAGAVHVDASRGLRFSLFGMAIQSAIAGRGVALTGSVFVEDDLAAGRLIKPFDISVQVDCRYYLLAKPSGLRDPRIAAFRDWLLEEVRGSEAAPCRHRNQ
ncbi:MAG TPA: transcriptional regulator GcvA [Arenicellales bacterium]|nr:transcriptional regulator GcvA [Arenicellales bacterium]